MAAVFFGLTTRIYKYSHTIGRSECSGTGFRQPSDLAVGEGGRLYVVNRSVEFRPDGVRITMCTFDEEYLGEFGDYGEGRGQFIWASSIALDSKGNVYVDDDYLHRVSVFNGQGEFLDVWGYPGSGDGELNRPAGLAFDREDNLYIVDTSNNRIQVFTKEGKFLAKWGREGSGEGEFNLPWGIDIDHQGDVWVADWRNDRIQKFTADGSFLASFGTSGDSIGLFNRPTGVAVDKDGDFYIADWLNQRVQAFTSEGRFITAFTGDAGISKWGEALMKANPDMARQRALARDLGLEARLSYPVAVEVDNEGRILILDYKRHRIQIYQKSS